MAKQKAGSELSHVGGGKQEARREWQKVWGCAVPSAGMRTQVFDAGPMSVAQILAGSCGHASSAGTKLPALAQRHGALMALRSKCGCWLGSPLPTAGQQSSAGRWSWMGAAKLGTTCAAAVNRCQARLAAKRALAHTRA